MLLISHNVFWFQSYPSEPPHHYTVNPEVFETLIAYYKSQKVDLLFLQEIQSAEVAERVANALNMKFDYASGSEYHSYGGVVLWRPNLNCKVLPNKIKAQFQRFCQIIKLDDRVILANVHLPSDAQLSEQAAYAKRRSEIDILLNTYSDLDLIVGDFNEEPKEALDLYLSQKGFFDSFVKISGDTKVSTKGGRRGDYFRLRNKYLELVEKFEIKNLKTETMLCSTGKLLSDHFPLLLQINL